MKKFLIIISGGFIFLTSCEKKLDQKPLSSATTETFYSQTADFIQASNAVYNDLRGWPDRLLNLSETRSDNLYAVSDGGVRDWEGINSFHRTIAANPYVTEAWNANFNGIFRANTLLQQLQKNGTVITDASLRTRLEAETKFLRAFFYFDLVRYFGKVPLVDHPVSGAEALNIDRASVADVYNLILSDLQFAGTNLPDVTGYSAADKGRATKWAAKALEALVHMTRSAPTYGIDGPGLGLNEWGTALSLLNEVINSTRFSFITSYPTVFSYTNEMNSEVVFDIQYATGLNPVVGGTFPWVLVPDTWFQANGKGVQGGLTIRPVSNDLLNAYPTGDTRKAFTIQTGYTYNGVAETRSFVKKYVDLTKVPSNRLDWPINFIAIRYTDVLMMKAECILHGAPGTQADVDAIVNQVRTRAGLGNITGVTLTQLLQNRRLEFVGEGSRWHDLVRFGVVDTVIPAWIAAEDAQQHAMQPFNKNYIIYPVPQSELDVKPGFYQQNLGY